MRRYHPILFVAVACSTYPDHARRQEGQTDAGRVMLGVSTSPSKPEASTPEQLAAYPGFRCFYYQPPEQTVKPGESTTMYPSYYPLVGGTDTTVTLLATPDGDKKILDKQTLNSKGWRQGCLSGFLVDLQKYKDCCAAQQPGKTL